MYDVETRLRLAEELVDAFGEGGWDASELAERAAGRLDRWPGWLDALAFHIVAVGGTRARSVLAGAPDHVGRPRLVHAVERFLREYPPGNSGSDEPAPRLIRELARAAGGRAAATPGSERGVPGEREVPGERAAPSLRWPVAAFHSVPALADRLELDVGQLLWLADARGLERTVGSERLRNYRYRWVPRRRGLPRLIEAPKLRLKEVQRILLREILDAVPAHGAACGFVRGRGAIDHAARHCGQAAVLSLDLRDFFASITAARVLAIFAAIGYPPPVARVLAGLTTNATAQLARDALRDAVRRTSPESVAAGFHLERRLAAPHLPQGAPTSPALANLAAFGLDRRLTALAAALDLRYSRYADDLALSGDSLRRGDRARDVSSTVAAIVRSEGFVVHPGKSVLRTAARRQRVTGIVVNDRPNLAREEYDRLRAMLHRAARDGPGSVHGVPGVDRRSHLRGRVAWVQALNPGHAAKLERLWETVNWDAE